MNKLTESIILAMDYDAFLGFESLVAAFSPRRVRVLMFDVAPLDMSRDEFMFETTEDFMQDALHEILMDEYNKFNQFPSEQGTIEELVNACPF